MKSFSKNIMVPILSVTVNTETAKWLGRRNEMNQALPGLSERTQGRMMLNLNFMESPQGIVIKNRSAEVGTGPGLSLTPLTYLLRDISSMSNISMSHFFTFKKVAMTVPVS